MSFRLLRFTVGRWLIHAGLRALPPGKVRTELEDMLRWWGNGVRARVAEDRARGEG